MLEVVSLALLLRLDSWLGVEGSKRGLVLFLKKERTTTKLTYVAV
jgi:hypothetical protein